MNDLVVGKMIIVGGIMMYVESVEADGCGWTATDSDGKEYEFEVSNIDHIGN